MAKPLKIMVIAGEASGDVYGGMLAQEILKLSPNTQLFGMGGGAMAQAGVKIHYPLLDLAIIGFLDIFKNIPTFIRLLRMTRELLRVERPDALVLIDYPGFNLRVAAQAKSMDIPVVYYISPQVWAWNPGRIHHVARVVSRMLVVLPFEEELYKKIGCPVTFVGHPLLDVLAGIREARRKSLDKSLVVLLPGSREGEVRRLLPVMLKVAKRMTIYEPCEFILPLAPTISRLLVGGMLREAKVFVRIVAREKEALPLRKAADFALVASGTATLETALMGVPHVILYKVAPLNYWLAKKLIRVPFIGLTNLLAGKKVVPEIIQDEMQPEVILPQALALLQDTEQRSQVLREFTKIAKKLGQGGASRRAAKAVLEIASKKH